MQSFSNDFNGWSKNPTPYGIQMRLRFNRFTNFAFHTFLEGEAIG